MIFATMDFSLRTKNFNLRLSCVISQVEKVSKYQHNLSCLANCLEPNHLHISHHLEDATVKSSGKENSLSVLTDHCLISILIT